MLCWGKMPADKPLTLTDTAAEAKPGKLVPVRRDDAAAEFLGAQQGPHQAEERGRGG